MQLKHFILKSQHRLTKTCATTSLERERERQVEKSLGMWENQRLVHRPSQICSHILIYNYQLLPTCMLHNLCWVQTTPEIISFKFSSIFVQHNRLPTRLSVICQRTPNTNTLFSPIWQRTLTSLLLLCSNTKWHHACWILEKETRKTEIHTRLT